MDALFIVDVKLSTARSGALVKAISEYIEYRVDELNMVSFDKQTDLTHLNQNNRIYGRSALIIDNTTLFNFDPNFPTFGKFQETIQGSSSIQIS